MINNRNLPASDIFARVKDHPGTVDEKAQLLARYDRKDIRWLVDFAYNCDTTKLPVLPEFKRSNRPSGIDYMTILSAIPRIEAALKHKDNEAIWNKSMALVLENVTGGEADLLVALFSGKKFDGVSKAVLKRVYPQFFRESDTPAL
ncbi:hypothetical protein pf16_200 [Pseudomonas phage pf16]|uniref:Uncharacterized protein n=1 Tax=Pseudomonas phage pf16 TaxID=1815630 RepID=A0A1S5R478_9CAUD|nr:hypothetical protein FDG98_gp098 [Pseudomonas phage pf16]AND75123.1 hypothetical protein pf16_200 [Pseudomonas phage pf16]